jgi:hypothetical protein
VASDARPLAEDERALLDRIAQRLVELHLEIPAILTLEGGKPLSLVASQMLVFFEPIVLALLPLADYRKFALLIERRDAVEALIQSIEARSESRRAKPRAESGTPPRSS